MEGDRITDEKPVRSIGGLGRMFLCAAALACALAANVVGDIIVGDVYVWFNVGRIVMFILLALAFMRGLVLDDLTRSRLRWMPWAAAAAIAVSVAVLLSPLAGDGLPRAAGAIATGGSIIFLAACWFALLADYLTSRDAMRASLLAIAIEGAVRVFGPGLVGWCAPGAYVILAGALVFSVASLARVSGGHGGSIAPAPGEASGAGDGGERGDEHAHAAEQASPAGHGPGTRLGKSRGRGAADRAPHRDAGGSSFSSVRIAEVVLLGLVCGVALVAGNVWTQGASANLLRSGFSVGIPLLVLAVVELAWRLRPRPQVVRAVALATAAAILAVLYFGGSGSALLVAVVLALPEFVNVAVYLRVLEGAYRFPQDALGIFAVERGSFMTAYFVAYAACVAWFSSPIAAVPQSVALFAMSCLLLLGVNWLFGTMGQWGAGASERVRTSQTGDASASDGTDAGGHALDLAHRCVAAASAAGLTPRESQVLELACAGLSKKQMAHELGIAEDTASYYLRRVYAKLDVHTRQELILRVLGER